MPAPAHPHHRQLTLANGLRVSLRHAPRLKRCAAVLRVAAGSHDAPLAWPGLAHFLEHLLFLGTERFPAREGLMAYVQRHGGQVNASTRERTTDFFFEVPTAVFEAALERLANMLTQPRLALDDQVREREVLHAEYVAWSTDEAAQHEQALLQGVAEGHPLRGFHAGNRDTLPVSREDFQQALRAFYQGFYQTGQMSLSLCGPQPLADLHTLAQRFSERLTPGQHREQIAAPALLASDEHRYVQASGRQWHQLIAGDAPAQALDFLCTWLNTSATGGLLAELHTRRWASGLHAKPLYQFGQQALLSIGITLCDDNPPPVQTLLHDWLSFFAHSDWTQLREEYTLLIARQQQVSGALALARQDIQGWAPHLSDADAAALKALLMSLHLPAAREAWQLPALNPFLRTAVKEQRPGLIRGQTSAHRGLRTFAQDRSRGRKDLPALTFSHALPDDTGEGALYLRWRFDSPVHGDVFPRLEHSLQALSEQARQAGVVLSFDAAGNDWQLKLSGLHEPMPAVLEQVARRLNMPADDTGSRPPSHTPPTMAIRQLLKALPGYCTGATPENIGSHTALAPLPAAGSTACWQGLGVGLPAACEAAIKSAAGRLPGHAQTGSHAPLHARDQRVYHTLNTGSAEAAVLLFYPVPTAALADEACWRLLAHLAQPPFYQRLRVELQLGYAVFSGIRQFNGHTGLLFGVQSPSASVENIVEQVHAFLQQLPGLIDTVKDAATALAQQFCATTLPTAEAAELLWQASLAGHPSDYLAQLQALIGSRTRQDLLDAAQQLNAGTAGGFYLTNKAFQG
ncbi:pyrroloquinoline quinone biosynthesis protein PqqF [Pseudomonas sp. SDO528_S397]